MAPRENLVIAQTLYRIHTCRLPGLRAHRHPCDRQGDKTGTGKVPPMELNFVRKGIQPDPCAVIAHGQPDKDCSAHDLVEVTAEEIDNPRRTGSQNFPDANFLCPPLRGESGQSEQAKSRYKYRQHRKVLRKGFHSLLCDVLFLVFRIQELVVEYISWIEF